MPDNCYTSCTSSAGIQGKAFALLLPQLVDYQQAYFGQEIGTCEIEHVNITTKHASVYIFMSAVERICCEYSRGSFLWSRSGHWTQKTSTFEGFQRCGHFRVHSPAACRLMSTFVQEFVGKNSRFTCYMLI